MLKFLKIATLSALAGLGAAAALPTAANADGIYFGLEDGGPRFGIHAAARDGRWHGRRDDWRRDDWRRYGRYGAPPRCSPGRALVKAQSFGLHRVYIRDVGRDTIRVGGRRNGERITVTFSRAPSCPVVGF